MTLFSAPRASRDEPVMCTADLSNRPAVKAQLSGYHEAFGAWRRTERMEHGFRWVFEHRPGLEAQLRQLMKNESECCRFLEFELQSAGDELTWTTWGGPTSAAMVDEYAQLPDRLREHGAGEAGVRAIKARAQASGLTFRADEAVR